MIAQVCPFKGAYAVLNTPIPARSPPFRWACFLRFENFPEISKNFPEGFNHDHQFPS